MTIIDYEIGTYVVSRLPEVGCGCRVALASSCVEVDAQLGRITASWRGVGGERVYQVTMLKSGAIKNRWAHEINFAGGKEKKHDQKTEDFPHLE